MNFRKKLESSIKKNQSRLCIGLDPDVNKIPEHIKKEKDPIFSFNKAIIDETIGQVCAYKPNIAFYEAEGVKGITALQKTIDHIAGRVPVILDAKRGDIGNTAKAYAKAAFEELKADAVTLAPYMGFDSLEPFLNYKDKGAFVLCLTSNKGAEDFQKPDLYKKVAKKCLEWSKVNSNIGLVVGATNPEQISEIRSIAPGLVFLVPGVGAQGGSLEEVLNKGIAGSADQVVINSARGIIYASSDKDFAKKAKAEAIKLRDKINNIRPSA